MDEFPRMLYKAGGPEEIHGGRFTTLIVNNDEELDAALADGWSMTTPDAIEAAKAIVAHQGATTAAVLAPAAELEQKVETPPGDTVVEDTPPTRAELEQKATELGITFGHRIGDAKLAALIEAKLKA